MHYLGLFDLIRPYLHKCCLLLVVPKHLICTFIQDAIYIVNVQLIPVNLHHAFLHDCQPQPLYGRGRPGVGGRGLALAAIELWPIPIAEDSKVCGQPSP